MTDIAELILKVALFFAGLTVLLWTILSAVRSFVLPRSENAGLTRKVFIIFGRTFYGIIKNRDYARRDRVMAFFAPITLLSLPIVWLALVMFAYTLMFWAVSDSLNLREALVMSGSSLMTLGFKFTDEIAVIVLAFSEAALGMMFIALLIGYLPTMYSAFSERERLVTRIGMLAGEPASIKQLFFIFHVSEVMYDENRMSAFWQDWQDWFAHLEESHTTLAPLNFFRSPAANRSWLTSAGVVLEAASLIASSVKVDRAAQAGIAIRSGTNALGSIAGFFRIEFDSDPQPTDPISITQDEYNTMYDALAELGIPMREDREQCWRDYAGWRVNYDTLLLRLAVLTMAPQVAWVSDREPVAYTQPEIAFDRGV